MALLRKTTCNIRHPMGLRHPVLRILEARGCEASSIASLASSSIAYCIWSVISSFSNLNWWSSSLGLFYHVPLKRDQGDSDWKLRLNDTPNTLVDCTKNLRAPVHLSLKLLWILELLSMCSTLNPRATLTRLELLWILEILWTLSKHCESYTAVWILD